MHQAAVLSCHREENLLERIRVIIDECQHATETVYEVVQEASVDVGFDAVDEEG
jgi:hypothetical protein